MVLSYELLIINDEDESSRLFSIFQPVDRERYCIRVTARAHSDQRHNAQQVPIIHNS